MHHSKFELKRHILKKMVRHNWWGGKHTAFDNIPRGVPKHLRKEVRKELKNLIRDKFIIKKPTCYGLHVSLNVKKKSEIEIIIFD